MTHLRCRAVSKPTLTTLALVAVALWGCDSRRPAEPLPAPLVASFADWRPTAAGALVESVVPTGPGDLYGLEPGDVLVSWRQGDQAGTIASPLDAIAVERDMAPLGDLRLGVVRGDDVVGLTARSGRWEVEWLPSDPAADGAEIEFLRRRLAAKDEDVDWLHWARTADRRGSAEVESWYRILAATRQSEKGDAAKTAEVLAAAGSEPTLDAPQQATLRTLEAEAWKAVGEKERAAASLEKALRLLQEAGRRLGVAAVLVRQAELLGISPGRKQLRQALRIFDDLAPQSVERAHVLNLLGNVAFFDSRLDEAREFYGRALRIREQVIPGSHREADSYSNLGLVARQQGHLDDAERWVRQTYEFYASQGSGQRLAIAGTANTLALIERDKGNDRNAREYWQRSLDAFRAGDPDSLAVAGVLSNLGNLSRRLGDLATAEARHREALDIRRRVAPGSRWEASSLHNLGVVVGGAGDHVAAREYLEEALKLKARGAPNTDDHANSILALGQLSLKEGKFQEAETLLREGLAMRRQFAPQTTGVAEILVDLGRLMAKTGRLEEGEASWREGLDLLDSMRVSYRFNAQERSVFGARFQDFYIDLAVGLALTLDRPEDALHITERSKSRALRSMAMQRLVGRHSGDQLDMSRELPPMTSDELVAALAPGTVLVSYSVSDTYTLILTLSVGSDSAAVEATRIDVSREDLAARVERFRALVARGADTTRVEPALLAQGAKLYATLLEPLSDRLATAERLILVPDGPLTVLPFAALVRSRDPVEFFGERMPISFAPSATIAAWTRREQRRGGEVVSLSVFARSDGAPDIDGLDLPPLPGAATEAAIIAEFFPAGSRLFLDERARESTFKRAARGPAGPDGGEIRYLHLATHAVLDHRTPLNSALVLAPDDDEDGLLHAWEVIEQVQTPFDLVTLSACDTGLGRSVEGEGVLGLSHAFLYSGARSLVTSLWKVSDASTTDWMAAFYAALTSGSSRDEAVLAAQRQLMRRDGQIQHPHRWAAFQLWGDGEL